MTGLALQNVSLRFGRRGPWVLTGVNGVLPRGTVTAVTGRNGAGKTTLLRVLAGVLAPTRGEVMGRPAVVGWVPERFPAEQAWTTRQYLTTVGRVRGRTLGAPVIDAWAERLHLTPFLDTRLSELSKGTAQKVGLVQALLVRPGLLVLDEPWEGLDAATRTELPALVREVTAAGGVVVVSDHRGELAGLHPDAEWCLAEGRLTVRATSREAQVIEVVVDAEEVAAVVAWLRAGGHVVRSVGAAR
ncbi:ATP-binding cassette domain-containing protein [Cryptosporangium arvum]|uniref:ATP-binding cassette domain-containing protein n=1 Tax=Cryptosporangium arvum TaxID=80871 RepID=UPI0004BBE9E0|nr:ABC transporter ATP-binding protein [Cryptosporangium arvum]